MKLGKFVLALGTVFLGLALGAGFVSCKGDGLEDPVEGDGKTIIAIDISTTAKSAASAPAWNESAMGLWGWSGNWVDADLNAMGITGWNNTVLQKYGTGIYYFVFPEDAKLPIGATVCFHDDAGEPNDRFNVDSVTLKRGDKKIVKNGKLTNWDITYDDLVSE